MIPYSAIPYAHTSANAIKGTTPKICKIYANDPFWSGSPKVYIHNADFGSSLAAEARRAAWSKQLGVSSTEVTRFGNIILGSGEHMHHDTALHHQLNILDWSIVGRPPTDPRQAVVIGTNTQKLLSAKCYDIAKTTPESLRYIDERVPWNIQPTTDPWTN